MEKRGKELNEYDCFLLGKIAMETQESPSMAIEWFEEAKRKANPGYVEIQGEASSALAELYARVTIIYQKLKRFKRLNQQIPCNELMIT